MSRVSCRVCVMHGPVARICAALRGAAIAARCVRTRSVVYLRPRYLCTTLPRCPTIVETAATTAGIATTAATVNVLAIVNGGATMIAIVSAPAAMTTSRHATAESACVRKIARHRAIDGATMTTRTIAHESASGVACGTWTPKATRWQAAQVSVRAEVGRAA